MNNQIKSTSIILLLLILFSCAPKKQIYQSSSKRVIIIENDSILRHSELIGCFGNSNTLNYKKENGIVKVSGNLKTKQEGIFSLATDLYGSELKIEKDSLIIKQTGEIFYGEKFLKLKTEKAFEIFYIVLNGNKKKIKRSNIEEILTNTNLESFEITEMDKDLAKKKYGISKKYKTLKLVQK